MMLDDTTTSEWTKPLDDQQQYILSELRTAINNIVNAGCVSEPVARELSILAKKEPGDRPQEFATDLALVDIPTAFETAE